MQGRRGAEAPKLHVCVRVKQRGGGEEWLQPRGELLIGNLEYHILTLSPSGSSFEKLVTIEPSTTPHPIAPSVMRHVHTICSATLPGVAATSP